MTTPGILAAAAALAAVIIIVALAVSLWTTARDVRNAQHAADCHRDRVLERDRQLAQASGELEILRQLRDAQQAQIEGLAAELADLRAGALVGRHVAVNTPLPDDQSFRGVCTLELEDGGLVLTAAVLLEHVRGRDQSVRIDETPVGDIVIRAYSWAQVINADGSLDDVDETAANPQEV